MGLQIKKTASYLPSKIMKNSDFEKYLDTSDEWISSRTGIRQRHFAEKENSSDMVIKLCKKFDITDEEIEKIKLVVVSTITADYIMPNLATFVQNELKLKKDIFSMDMNMACSGFVGALRVAESMLNVDEYAVVISVEKLSSITDLNDRNTAVLFGDGAGGVIVNKDSSLNIFDCGTDFSKTALSLKDFRLEDNHINMQGKEVYRFATKTIYESIGNVLEKMGKKPNDIKYFLSHQANEKILKSACRKWDISTDKFPINLQNVGNTSSASIPILLDQLNKKSNLKKGDDIILCGFGAGLIWVSYYIKW